VVAMLTSSRSAVLVSKTSNQWSFIVSALMADLVITSKNESIFWTIFIVINAKLGNLGIEGLKAKINQLK
jgi:hypothetical protein